MEHQDVRLVESRPIELALPIQRRERVELEQEQTFPGYAGNRSTVKSDEGALRRAHELEQAIARQQEVHCDRAIRRAAEILVTQYTRPRHASHVFGSDDDVDILSVAAAHVREQGHPTHEQVVDLQPFELIEKRMECRAQIDVDHRMLW